MDRYEVFQNRVNKGEVIDWLTGSKTCFSCKSNVYDNVSDEDVLYGKITGCPVCHRTFCD